MEEKKTSVSMPDTKELLKAGTQFGHETKRWNPKMKKYIFGEKNNIHVIDVDKTVEGLKKASDFLSEASANGKILFVGTKKQASDIVREEAIRSGAYFIDARWAGGLLTNFKMIKESLNKLNSLETMFEEGVQDRTKYEVSRMKKEWQKLNRLYSGIKSLSTKPSAVVIVDTNFEKAAVKECKKISIPVVALIDTNSDPETADYVIPANDDAINSIKLVLHTLGDAVLAGNKGEGVAHSLKDYSRVEVKITKNIVNEEKAAEIVGGEASTEPSTTKTTVQPKATRSSSKGILERVKDEADKEKKGVETKPAKKAVKKAEKKPAAKKKAEAKKSEPKKAVKKTTKTTKKSK